jgi:hypothetical protein
VLAADYKNNNGKDTIFIWGIINKHMVIVLKNIPDEDIDREVQTQEIHSIKWLAADYNKHLLHHLHQVLHLEPVAYP